MKSRKNGSMTKAALAVIVTLTLTQAGIFFFSHTQVTSSTWELALADRLYTPKIVAAVPVYVRPDGIQSPLDKAGKNATFGLTPILGFHREKSNVIMGVAEGYQIDKVIVFVETLREVNFTGDLVLSVDWDIANEQTRGFYYMVHDDFRMGPSSNFNLVLYDIAQRCRRESDKKQLRLCNATFYKNEHGSRLTHDPRPERNFVVIRFELMWSWLQAYLPTVRIACFDVRDVFFQRHPFDSSEEEIEPHHLHVFREGGKALKHSVSGFWMEQGWGKESRRLFNEEQPINAGAIIGGQPAMDSFLRAMVMAVDVTGWHEWGADQGHATYLVYNKTLEHCCNVSQSVWKAKYGLVNTIGAFQKGEPSVYEVFDNITGDVRNANGQISPVFHQFVHPEIGRIVGRKKNEAMHRFRTWWRVHNNVAATNNASSKASGVRHVLSPMARNSTAPTLEPYHPLHFSSIVFVHVGKAGGETLRRSLTAGVRAWGPGRKVPPSRLDQVVKGYFHVVWVKPKTAIEDADAFLVNLRHPVDRMLSWYYFAHPDSCPGSSAACIAKKSIQRNPHGLMASFFRCFPSHTHLPMAFNGSHSEDCQGIARRTLDGRDEPGAWEQAEHMRANIRYHTNRTIDRYPNKGVLVVRMESLWGDLKDIDLRLGGNGTFGVNDGSKITHGSDRYTKGGPEFSPREYQVLCCALLQEMTEFRRVLDLAVNLNRSSKDATLMSVAQKCGASEWDGIFNRCSSI